MLIYFELWQVFSNLKIMYQEGVYKIELLCDRRPGVNQFPVAPFTNMV